MTSLIEQVLLDVDNILSLKTRPTCKSLDNNTQLLQSIMQAIGTATESTMNSTKRLKIHNNLCPFHGCRNSVFVVLQVYTLFDYSGEALKVVQEL